MRPEVRDAMAPFLDERFGNPSSIHRWGRQARNALEEARERLAAAIGAQRREIVFTGSGTEADNIALLGRWRSACRNGGASRAIVCTAIEHRAVGSAAQCAVAEGAELVLLGVDEAGRVQPEALDEALAAAPCLVSVMWANNEVGTVQPVRELAERCRAAGVTFHSDAVQAFGKLRVRVDEVPCDLLALSAHKIAGPKGIGALYIRDATPLLPLLHGGGQERALRPGTENVAAAVGFATAATLAVAEREAEYARLMALRTQLEERVRAVVGDVVINGPPGDARLPHIVSITVPGTDQEALIIGLDLEGVAASGASACASGAIAPSHVLTAMGAAGAGDAAVRLSIGRTTTADDIAFAAATIGRVAAQVRA
jgi:cysteine desulfurase